MNTWSPARAEQEAADKIRRISYINDIVADMLGGRAVSAVEEVCTITARGQTTVPKAIRQALGVGYGGCIAFRVA